MTGRGWSAKDLPLVGEDEKTWTVAEAAARLLLPVAEVRLLLLARRIEPVGKRRTAGAGKPGRCARVYRAKSFIEAYDRLYGDDPPKP